MKILCKLFGHPDRPHYHNETSVFPCNGGCEKLEDVYEITTCPRCGEWEKNLTDTKIGQKSIIESK